MVADYLDARAGEGSKPASLGHYKASIAKIHLLLDLPDPTQVQLVKLRLRAIRKEMGTDQRQARPLRFKGRCAGRAEYSGATRQLRGRPTGIARSGAAVDRL